MFIGYVDNLAFPGLERLCNYSVPCLLLYLGVLKAFCTYRYFYWSRNTNISVIISQTAENMWISISVIVSLLPSFSLMIASLFVMQHLCNQLQTRQGHYLNQASLPKISLLHLDARC